MHKPQRILFSDDKQGEAIRKGGALISLRLFCERDGVHLNEGAEQAAVGFRQQVDIEIAGRAGREQR